MGLNGSRVAVTGKLHRRSMLKAARGVKAVRAVDRIQTERRLRVFVQSCAILKFMYFNMLLLKLCS